MGLSRPDPGARAVCAKVASRIRAEAARVRAFPTAAAYSEAMFRYVEVLEAAAVLAETPATFSEALAMLPAELAAECRAMI
jgi:hypothetical protein